MMFVDDLLSLQVRLALLEGETGGLANIERRMTLFNLLTWLAPYMEDDGVNALLTEGLYADEEDRNNGEDCSGDEDCYNDEDSNDQNDSCDH